MKKKLPGFIFKKNYDNFYLFTEYDIVFNETFYSKLIQLINKIGTKNLFFEMNDSLNGENATSEIIKYNQCDIDDLRTFYALKVKNGKSSFPTHCIDHFIYDEGGQWEIFISLENELSVLACNDTIHSLFEVIFNPYEEETLEIKYKIIGDMFNDKNVKNEFLKTLEKNYQFSKNS